MAENPITGEISEAVVNIGSAFIPLKAGKFIGGGFVRKDILPIQFGKVENQVNHTFRHVVKAGFNRQAVQDAIQYDLQKIGNALPEGQYNGSVTVNGVKLEYSAFKLPDGVINVGRITTQK